MNEPIMYQLYKFAQGRKFNRVLNVGAGDQHKRKFPDPRTFINCKQYIGIDLVKGKDTYVDLEMDVKNLKFPDEHFDCVICTETLEHVDDIYQAASEIKRVLAKDGLLFISVPFAHVFHAYPNDYWRITPWGLDFLFRGLKKVYFDYYGRKKNPDTIFVVYKKAGKK